MHYFVFQFPLDKLSDVISIGSIVENLFELSDEEDNVPVLVKLASLVCNQLAKAASTHLEKEKFPDIRSLEMLRISKYENCDWCREWPNKT